MGHEQIAVGSVVADRYRIERLIGEGGMGTVWAARHTTTRKSVALKFLKSGETDNVRVRQRFIREARAACAIQHPSVIEVHDVLELEDSSPFIVMELLQGETFAALLAREKRVRAPVLARIMLPVCSAVGKAHELGIVHRDLKPENIFLEKGADLDAPPLVKVLDFGIAKLTAIEGDAAKSTANNTGTGALLGTPFYMSPEQMFGEKDVDHRSDIWALGIILYEALAGFRPTEAENIGQILKVVMTDAITPLRQRVPSVPDALADLVGRMLMRDRAKRPVDLREVCDVLRAYSNEIVPSFGAPSRPPAPQDELPTPSQLLGRATTTPEADALTPSERLARAPTAPEEEGSRLTPIAASARSLGDEASANVSKSAKSVYAFPRWAPVAVAALLGGGFVANRVVSLGREPLPRHTATDSALQTAVAIASSVPAGTGSPSVDPTSSAAPLPTQPARPAAATAPTPPPPRPRDRAPSASARPIPTSGAGTAPVPGPSASSRSPAPKQVDPTSYL